MKAPALPRIAPDAAWHIAREPAPDLARDIPRYFARLVVIAAMAVLVACGGKRIPHEKFPDNASVVGSADLDLDREIATFFDGHLAFRPNLAIDLGLHGYDGKVPDRSKAAIEAEIARLKTARATFEGIEDVRLSRDKRVEREIVLAEIRKELFELETRRRPFRDPFWYLFKFSLNPYIAREYAPAAERAAAMLRACEAAPAYYAQAEENLEPKLPKVWLVGATMMAKGVISFTADAKQAFADPKLAACLDRLARSVEDFVSSLQARMPDGTDEFRLGADNLVAMLRETEGITTDIATLERVARADLARNTTALIAAAKQLDPKRDVAAVIAEVTADKPADLKAEVEKQLAETKKLIADKQIVSLPRADVVEYRQSPAFMRGNFAAFSGAGPLEKAALPSYYYIAPPDPAWPAEQQKAYLMSRADLLFTTAHEVYPGHFVQGMHQRASGSRVIQAFETYTASEGWAHYVEEMMWDEGLGSRDPRMHIGQLKNALLRDVRFLVALGYHAGTMTPEQATQMFVEQGFADPGNAKQQALRGTIDPMFLGYTLGKLIIMELRADWQRAHPNRSLREFHDEFLRYGEAPLPVTRRMMLGDGAKPPLHGP